jgi:chaperonin GroES
VSEHVERKLASIRPSERGACEPRKANEDAIWVRVACVFGTLLQQVLAGAIYGALETPAEPQSLSPRTGIERQPGAKPMKFRPLHDRVVIRRIEGEEKTKGGIIIPDTAKEKPQEGEVIAAGPGARDESGKLVPLELKAGDRVLFGKWSGTEVKIDGEDLLIMKESDVMGVIEGASASKKKAA